MKIKENYTKMSPSHAPIFRSTIIFALADRQIFMTYKQHAKQNQLADRVASKSRRLCFWRLQIARSSEFEVIYTSQRQRHVSTLLYFNTRSSTLQLTANITTPPGLCSVNDKAESSRSGQKKYLICTNKV